MSTKIPAVIGVSDKSKEGNRFANTGNMTHAAAARRIVGDYVDFPTFVPWTEADITRLHENCSHIVIVLANAIRLGGIAPDVAMQHKIMAENLAKTDLPIVVFGLGSQAPKKPEVAEKLVTAPETVNLLHILGERSRNVAVRGQFTAEVLEHFGVKNALVTGCQSCFWHLTPEFPIEFTVPNAKSGRPIGFSYTAPLREWKIIQFAMENGIDMVGQQHIFEYLVKTGQDIAEDLDRPGLGLMKLFEQNKLDRAAYEYYLRDHFHMFYDLNNWFEYIKNFEFFFGSRFHGSMTAMIQGVPSVWVEHDTRTEELCNHLKLPSVRVDEAHSYSNLEQFMEHADYTDFYSAYPKNYKILYDYLDVAGLPNRLLPPCDNNQVRMDVSPQIVQPRVDTRKEIAQICQDLEQLSERVAALGVHLETHDEIPLIALPNENTADSEDRQRSRAAAYKDVARPNEVPEKRNVDDAVQLHGNTKLDRYPAIFEAVLSKHRNTVGANGARVLSFGCSTGEEVLSLGKSYFSQTNDRIIGVDVVPAFIEEAQKNNPDPGRITFALSSDKVLESHGPFDAIFAMSVLCRWPESKDVEDISELMPFIQFERYVTLLDRHLKVGGRLVIYNASFRFADLSFAHRYDVELFAGIVNSGFVKKFGPDNRSLGADYVYDGIIFRKRAAEEGK